MVAKIGEQNRTEQNFKERVFVGVHLALRQRQHTTKSVCRVVRVLISEHCFEIRGNLGLKIHFFVRVRMYDGKGTSMEC